MLEGLNIPQLQAVTSQAKSILVIAGAGSGKTKVLTHRIAFLVKERGVSPSNILALTFTRKAAKEMKERLTMLLTEKEVSKMMVGTFHSVSLKMLEQYGGEIGYEKYLSVYDEQDQEDILNTIITELGLPIKASQVVAALDSFGADCDKVEFQKDIADVVTQYRNRLKSYNALDYSSILTETLRLLRSKPDVFTYYHDKFQYVFVDEYQDCDWTQYYLHEALKPENLFVVGDDWQSIYAFRGSDVGIIKDFEARPGSEIIKLEQSFRCPENVLEMANRLIKCNTTYIDKEVWTENGQGYFGVFTYDTDDAEAEAIEAHIKAIVLRKTSYEFGDIAILTRTHAQQEKIIERLTAGLIPFKAAGENYNFWKSPESRYLISMLYVLHNRRNSFHFIRIARHLLYPMTASEWLDTEAKALKAQKKLLTYLIDERAGALSDLIEYYEANRSTNLFFVIREVLSKVDIAGFFARQGLTTKAANIAKALEYAEIWEGENAEDTTLEGFLSWFASEDIQTEIDDSDKVKVSTIHAAKGLEFKVVFVPQMVEGRFPHKRTLKSQEIEEERRLCYVAITRAKERLILSGVKTADHKGKLVELPQSRFLEEMQKEKEPHAL